MSITYPPEMLPIADEPAEVWVKCRCGCSWNPTMLAACPVCAEPNGQANGVIPAPDAIAMVKECANWDANCFPLAGGDVISMMVRFGLITPEAAKEAYLAVMKENGLERDHEGDGPYAATFVTPDDKIPF